MFLISRHFLYWHDILRLNNLLYMPIIDVLRTNLPIYWAKSDGFNNWTLPLDPQKMHYFGAFLVVLTQVTYLVYSWSNCFLYECTTQS